MMKKTIAMLAALAMLFGFSACTAAGDKETEKATPAATPASSELPTEEETDMPVEPLPENAPTVIIHTVEDLAAYLAQTDKYTQSTLTVAATANTQPLNAFGAEWDPHFFRPYNAENTTQEDWALIVERAQKLGLQKIRMMILPGWYEPQNDNADSADINWEGFTFDGEAFASILRELDVCQENGISVNLTVWGVNLGEQPDCAWLAYSDCGDWISEPTDYDEFAENVSALFQYLLNEKGYTCIEELTIWNEPDWAFKGSGGTVSFEKYVQLCRTVHNRLQADGIREKIKLILCDDTDTVGAVTIPAQGWFTVCLKNLNDIADGYSTHVYAFNADTNFKTINSWAKARNKRFDRYASGKQYTHNEFGSNLGIGAYHAQDIDDYSRGIFLSKMAQATLNSGSAGMLYWTFFDQRYNTYPNRNDSLMELGLFSYVDEGWRVRPIYHAWGLIMNYTVPGSNVFSMDYEGELSGTALCSPQGEWTYLITNGSSEDRVVTVENAHAENLRLEVHVYSEETVTESDEMILSSGVAYAVDGTAYVLVPANAFVVLTEIAD